jgi:hypothetical protein
MTRLLLTAAAGGLIGISIAAPPPKAATPKINFIDLQPKANQKLTDRFGRIEGNNLASMSTGEQTCADIRFNVIDSVLLLDSPRLTDHKAAKIEGIAVGRTARKLHFLQGTIFGTSNPAISDDTTIANYVVRYDNGATATVPVVYGKDVRDWSSPDDMRNVQRGKVAWTGDNQESQRLERHLNLYLCNWENPKSENRITSIDFVKVGNTLAAPFCVAISAED